MGIIAGLWAKLHGAVPLNVDSALIREFEALYGEACFRDLALGAVKTLLGNSISKCEFKTFTNGVEVKGREWYAWNVEPNKNENSSVYLRKIVNRLVDNTEALVVQYENQLLVADSFVKKDYTLYDDIFTQVTVGDFTFPQPFKQSDVLYWELSEKATRPVINSLYATYSKLLAFSMKAYQKSRGTRATFHYDTLPDPPKGVDGDPIEWRSKWLTDWLKQKIKPFMEAENGALPLGKGLDLKPFANSTTYSNETTRDIRALVSDIFDFTALGYGIPPALLRGDVQGTSEAVDQLLTFTIDPWADFLREEIVRKRIGREAHLRGNDLVIDTSQIKHVDVLAEATEIEKLIGSGAFSVNGVLRLLGRPTINEPWADIHHITKNFMPLEEALKAATGGTSK